MKVTNHHVYWGASPLAEEPVVVLHYELAKEELAQVHLMIRAMEDRFPQWLGAAPSGHAIAKTDNPALRLGDCVARWSLGLLNEVRGFLHDAGARATETGHELWVGFHNPELSRAVVEHGFKIAVNAYQPAFNARVAEQAVDQLLQSCRALHPDFQARILMIGARAAGIPVMQFLPRSKFWQYGWGKRSQVFMETSSNRDGYLGGTWQQDKSMTKRVLHNLGVPVPMHVLVGAESDLPKASERIGFPCVVKPLAGGGGRGVTANIRNLNELAVAFKFAQGESRNAVMVEQMVNGSDYRLMVIDQRLVAVIGREPSFVIGDGKKTIRTLLAEVNSTRSANLVKSRYLYPIADDETLKRHLATQNCGLDDKLPKGRRVTLRSNANRSTGGICTNKTNEAHPEVAAMAEQIAAVSGLYAVGIDYLTTDICQSPAESGGMVIEINSVPGLAALVAAGFDEEDLGLRILGSSLGSVPIDLVVVDEQQAALREQTLMSQVLKPGYGVVCGPTVKIGIFKLQMVPGNSHPWGSVHTALKNRTLESLELIVTPDKIIQHGLPLAQLRSFTIEADDLLPKVWKSVLAQAVERWKYFSSNQLN